MKNMALTTKGELMLCASLAAEALEAQDDENLKSLGARLAAAVNKQWNEDVEASS